MGRVRCPICNQSTQDDEGSCQFCGNALPSADAIEQRDRERAGRALKEARAKAALTPKGTADPDSETLFAVRHLLGFTSVFIDWDTATRYEIKGGSGHICYHAGEVGGTKYDRATRGQSRPWTIEVRAVDGSPEGALAFKFVRPWTMLFSRVDAFDGDGTAIGSVHARWAFFRRQYDFVDPSGNVLAQAIGPWLRPWTFEIRVAGAAQGTIAKQWSGLGRELFTTADTFGLSLDPSWSRSMRGLAFAATFLIDFIHFENKGGLSSAAGLGDVATD